ncbi:dienelactone hydrolase family protein [uncultured Legionella sp.]|uniref:dienelactone hydrolase family protein n=1 Tax=uncultured Legionella sp. TaxID=210934 RepID=UPI0026169C09|nr:dienelactone hydrolase family protein [uncultured Legionella sp.]
MHEANFIYHQGAQELHGFLAFDEQFDTPRPAVIVAHDWSGRNDFACQKARVLAEMGYVGFASDVYGQGRLGGTNDEKMALMHPLVADRALLRARLLVAYDAVAAMPEVDKTRIAVIGFCFGGLCALDLARSGADIKGVVSFHGLLNKPEGVSTEEIKAKVLVLHGYDDPMVSPEHVTAFCQEMTDAKVDWQVHMYGNVQHAFTNPLAHDMDAGLVFNSLAEQRSWLAMRHFLQEIF